MSIKDPICGGIVEPAEARHKTEYSGHEYYFCSDACLHKFREKPEQFLKQQA